MCIGLNEEECSQQAKRSVYSSLLTTGKAGSGVLYLILVSQITERHGHAGAHPLGAHQDGQGAEAQDAQEPKETGFVQSREEAAPT